MGDIWWGWEREGGLKKWGMGSRGAGMGFLGRVSLAEVFRGHNGNFVHNALSGHGESGQCSRESLLAAAGRI